MKLREDIIPLQIASGTASGTATVQLSPGKIIGVAVFTNGKETSSPGFVRAEITNSAGSPLSKMQSLANYRRSQGGSYADSFKPLDAEGGERVTINVLSTGNFAETVLLEFVFLYAKTCEQPQY